MVRFLARLAGALSVITFLAGASFVVWGIWELLQPRFDDSSLVAAAIMFPVTIIAAPIYAIVELNDWRLLLVLVITVVLTTVLRKAKRTFEQSV